MYSIEFGSNFSLRQTPPCTLPPVKKNYGSHNPLYFCFGRCASSGVPSGGSQHLFLCLSLHSFISVYVDSSQSIYVALHVLCSYVDVPGHLQGCAIIVVTQKQLYVECRKSRVLASSVVSNFAASNGKDFTMQVNSHGEFLRFEGSLGWEVVGALNLSNEDRREYYPKRN